MTQENAWVTFWDRENRRVLVLSTRGSRHWTFLEHDRASSAPGVYDVWRKRRSIRTEGADGSSSDEEIGCVEIHMDGHDVPLGFPHHLISQNLLGSPTLWGPPDADDPMRGSFLWWSGPGAEVPNHVDDLRDFVEDFGVELRRFPGGWPRTFTVGDLVDDRNWEWGCAQGVYCFVTGGEVVYVRRALTSLGARIDSQLKSQEDPEWASIVTDRETVVRVFAVNEGNGYIASALQTFLIDRLNPRFNLRQQ